MIPNFALSLSFEGISLLRHIDGAWARIADVALDTSDLEAAVIGLRAQATALDPEGAKVALIIPNEQIRYLDMPDLGGDTSARETAIRTALDGATPYPVEDLAFDYTQSRGRLLIAAVAKETLEEAEQFAKQHGFDAVSFAADAPADAFQGAVHFGKAKGWKGRVKRLPEAISIVDPSEAALTPVPQPEPEPAAPPAAEALPEPAAQPEPDQVAAPEPAAESPPAPAAPEPKSDAPKPEAPKPEAASEVTSEPAPAPIAGNSTAEFDFSAPAPEPKTKTPAPAEPATVAQEQSPELKSEPSSDPVADGEKTAAPSDAEPGSVQPAADEPDLGADLYFSTIRAALADAGEAPKVPEAPRPEVKARFTPVAPTDEGKDAPSAEAPTPTAAPATGSAPKAGPAAAPKSAPTSQSKAPEKPEDAARARAKALAASTPLDSPETSDAVRSTGAAAPSVKPRFTPAKSPDADLKEAGVTSAKLAADEDKPTRTAGAAAAAMRFLSKRRKAGDTDAAPVAPAALDVDAKPNAPSLGAPKTAAPVLPKAPQPVSSKAPVAPPKPLALTGGTPTAPTKSFGTIAATSGASLNKPAPSVDPQAKEEAPAKPSVLARLAARRSAKRDKKAAATGPSNAAAASLAEEAARMTVFGARNQDIGGKPRFLGLMLTAALLLFLAGVAAWASVFLQDGLAGLFKRDTATTEAVASLPDAAAPVVQPDVQSTEPAAQPAEPTAEAEDLRVAALETAPDPDPAPALSRPVAPKALTPEQAAATYAATGIWQRAPAKPMTPPTDGLDDIYVASIDPSVRELDAVALPDPLAMAQEPNLRDPGLPPPAGMTFDFDERGLVRATPEGALTPEGMRIYAGLPPAVPPRRQAAQTAPAAQAAPEDGEADVPAIGQKRPEARPSDLIEQRERATFTGISRAELARLRPVLRPQTEQEQAVQDTPDSPATDRAVAQSLVPVTRPRNMNAIVRRTERQREAQEQVQTASAAAVAPRSVAPSGPTAGGVARNATVRNAINLGKVSLIGIYGTPANRRALVRLPNGQYKKVKVGDRVDGGKVAAIGESELRYSKSGRNLVLKMPRG